MFPSNWIFLWPCVLEGYVAVTSYVARRFLQNDFCKIVQKSIQWILSNFVLYNINEIVLRIEGSLLILATYQTVTFARENKTLVHSDFVKALQFYGFPHEFCVLYHKRKNIKIGNIYMKVGSSLFGLVAYQTVTFAR